MKWLLLLACSSITYSILGQETLTKATVKATLDNNTFQVEQRLYIEVPDSITSLDLKSLIFESSTISKIQVAAENQLIAYENVDTHGLIHLVLNIDKLSHQEIIISYQVGMEQSAFYLPLFFTDLAALSSDNDFFKMAIELPEGQAYFIHFPAMPIDQQQKDGTKTLQFELPALPSVIRMELLSSNMEKPLYIRMVDWGVAILFIVIGYLIWRNRKQLIYG